MDKYICILAMYVLFSCQYAVADITDTTTYNVTFSTTSCGTPVVRQYKRGNVLTIYADNDSAHIFIGWSDGVTANPRTYTVSSDTSFIAQYVAGGSGFGVMHTATVSMSGCTTRSVRQYSSIANITLTADLEPHYHFVSWSDGNTDNPRFIHITSDTNLVANVSIDQYSVTLSGDSVTLTGAGVYGWGSTVTVSATPAEHYHFVRWSDGNTNATRTFRAEADVALTAIVEGDPFTLTTSATNGTTSGDGTYPYNTTVTLTATADAHYHFVSWNDGDTNSVRTVTVTGNQTYVATFAIDTHIVTLLATNGVVTGDGTYSYGTEIQITATPDQHYHFVQWSDGVTTATRNITVTQNITLTAVFEGDAFNVTATTPANGSVMGGGTYPYGSSVLITAMPSEHYHFVSWSDGDTTNPRTFVLTQDTMFSANIAINRFTVSSMAQHGTINGTGEYDYGSNVVLTAVPDEHYLFVRWADGDTSQSKTITVTCDTSYDVVFSPMIYTIAVTSVTGTTTGEGEYAYLDLVQLTAIPDEGYKFTRWSNGSEYNPYIFEAVEDVTLEAYFEEVVAVETVSESVEFYYSNGWLYNPEGVRLYLYSTEGKLVKTGDADVDMTGLPEGVYFVRDTQNRHIKIVHKIRI